MSDRTTPSSIDALAAADLALLAQRARIQSRVDGSAVARAAAGTAAGASPELSVRFTPKKIKLGGTVPAPLATPVRERKKHARSDPRAGNKRRSHRTKSGARVRPASAMARPRSYPKTLRSIEKIVRSTTATKNMIPFEIATLQQSLDTYIVSSPMSTPPETRQSMRLCQKLERSVSRSLESLLTDTPKSPTFLSDPHAHTVAVRRALHHEARSQHMWSKVVRKELRATLKPLLLCHEERQRRWFVAIGQSVFLQCLKTRWDAILSARNEERRRNISIARVQSGWKSRYSSRMEAKHQRTVEILREKVWIARLNLRTRARAREAFMVRSFVQMFAKHGRFSVLIRTFKWRVIRPEDSEIVFGSPIARLRLLQCMA